MTAVMAGSGRPSSVLEAVPAAGHEYVVHDLLGVFLVVAIVLIVLDSASH